MAGIRINSGAIGTGKAQTQLRELAQNPDQVARIMAMAGVQLLANAPPPSAYNDNANIQLFKPVDPNAAGTIAGLSQTQLAPAPATFAVDERVMLESQPWTEPTPASQQIDATIVPIPQPRIQELSPASSPVTVQGNTTPVGYYTDDKTIMPGSADAPGETGKVAGVVPDLPAPRKIPFPWWWLLGLFF